MTPFSNIEISEGEKIYFASDFHLGVPNHAQSLVREKKIVKWLEEINPTCKALFLVGDIFDFWFEYKNAIPKGYVRFQGAITSFTDQNIPVFFFTGNHDMWMFDYFEKELGVRVIHKPETFVFNQKKFLIGHGDGLGPKDYTYKFIKFFFRSKVCQWLFERIHPNLGIGVANYWSSKSRLANNAKDDPSKGEKEWLYIYCNEIEAKNPHNFYIFGHRHLPTVVNIGNKGAKYLNLGEWVNYYTYASFDGQDTTLHTFSI